MVDRLYAVHAGAWCLNGWLEFSITFGKSSRQGRSNIKTDQTKADPETARPKPLSERTGP